MSQASMSYPSQVIMEKLPPGISEQSILHLLKALGEPVIKVRIVSSPSTHAIVQLPNTEFAKSLVYQWNGKVIPKIYPASIFMLKQVATKIEKHEVWVGNLTPDVNDFHMFKYFSSFYNTVYNVKVIPHKGCGFVTFADQDEHKHCLNFMSGMSGLGFKKIIVNQTRKSIFNKREDRFGAEQVPGLEHNRTGSGHQGGSQIKTSNALKEVPKEHESFWRVQHLLVSEAILPPGVELPDDLLRSGNTAIKEDASVDPLKDNTLVEYTNTNQLIEESNLDALERDAVLWDGLEASGWVYGFDDPDNLYCTANTPH